MYILATKSGVPILGQVSSVLGWLMDGIYKALDGLAGIENIGLCIIIFTLLVYLIMTPMQIKQQKFSKMNSVMSPELQAIQKKYRGKRDQVSMQRMQEETSMVYQKYGVSPTGSCLQLLIQMPILLSLYQVIYRIPAYVGSVRNAFSSVVSHITNVNGYEGIIAKFIEDNKIVSRVGNAKIETDNQIIDFLYSLSPGQWDKLADIDKFSGFSNVIDKTADKLFDMQQFTILNIADNPWAIIKDGFSSHAYLLVFAALLIPFLAWFTQWLNTKMMTPVSTANADDPMANSMRAMNVYMPIMSAVFCFTLPVGMGIYWIAGAVIRCVQMLLINKHMEKIDIDDLVKANMEKANKKREKMGLPPQKITNQAHQNARNIDRKTNTNNNSAEKNAENMKKSTDYYRNANPKPGSIAAKANMVKQYEEKNKKKK